MSRYLTPSKVGLLALIYVYADGVVPSSATIPLLSFLASYVLPQIRPDSQHYRDLLSHGRAIPIETFLKSTITHPSQIPGRSIWDLLLKKLWEIDSFDALHLFFHNLSSILQAHDVAQRDEDERDSSSRERMLLSRRSPLGGFVRRAQLEFTRLQFHDGIALWKDFVVYRMPTLSSWRRRNPGAGYYNFDVNLQSQDGHQALLASCTFGELVESNAARTMLSIDDLVKLLECQVDLMQRTGDRLPQTAKASTHAMTISNPAAPSLSHYILFLDAWRAGDYPSAFEYLHRYFDYTMQTRGRSYYQYALLNLAVLQADFGCFYEAIIAMNEAISTARENDDLPCLNYSLSWLYHFGKAHPAEMENIRKTSVLGTEKEALSFLKTKAKESQMWSLLGTTLLSEAKYFLSNGDNTAQALENLVKASQVIVSKNVTNAYGSQVLMQSFIYSRLGMIGDKKEMTAC
ncbi:MAG: hypothetical protein Q9214_005637 [Letrouitia sp. 1 TL-2023]